MEIVVAGTSEIAMVRALWREYWTSMGLDSGFQGFSSELETLPGKYGPPRGRLALALMGGEAAGCVALRAIDGERCEAKRLFVRPRFRGSGIGRKLLEWAIAEARSEGFRELYGDTLPSMEKALAMYKNMGFKQIGPYSDDPTPGAVYLGLDLWA